MKQFSLATLPQEPVSHNPRISKQVMLRAGDLPHITNFAQACFPPNEVAQAHAHCDMCELFFIESGQGVIAIDGTDYDLVPGVCVVVEPNEVHEVRNTGHDDLRVTYFGLLVP